MTIKEAKSFLVELEHKMVDEAIDIFVARNLIPSHQHLDEDEVIDVESWELKDLLELIYKGKMTDAKTVAAITAYAVKYGTDNN